MGIWLSWGDATDSNEYHSVDVVHLFTLRLFCCQVTCVQFFLIQHNKKPW